MAELDLDAYAFRIMLGLTELFHPVDIFLQACSVNPPVATASLLSVYPLLPSQRAYVDWVVVAELSSFVRGDPFRRAVMFTHCLLPVTAVHCRPLTVDSAVVRSSAIRNARTPPQGRGSQLRWAS